jgi:hypothetical protein
LKQFFALLRTGSIIQESQFPGFLRRRGVPEYEPTKAGLGGVAVGENYDFLAGWWDTYPLKNIRVNWDDYPIYDMDYHGK